MRWVEKKFPGDDSFFSAAILPDYWSFALAGFWYSPLEPGRTGAEEQPWSLRKQSGYFFREVFGRELFGTLK
jgi:hypothetical protein